MTGWRSQIYHWSRNSGFLKRLALIIAGGSFFLALILIALAPDTGSTTTADPLEQKLRAGWRQLDHAEKPMPHELVRWLYHATDNIQHVCKVLDIKTTTWPDYEADGRLAGLDARALLAKHGVEPDIVSLWEDYIRAQLTRDPAAKREVAAFTARQPPLITAHLIQAYEHKETDPARSLAALMQEAALFPSPMVREAAVAAAFHLKDLAVLRRIADQPEWWASLPGHQRHAAASMLVDNGLLFRTLLQNPSLMDGPPGTIALALLSASVWYIILVLHGVRGRARWAAPLLPLTAGIFSILPVFMAIAWQDHGLGMTEDAPFPHDLWYQVGGVGMREELSKLLLASLFMPWLLIKRPPGGAVMVGAFVGLGFALEENINYYLREEGGVALARFFTANFLHAALTGISTHALYQLLRSRFGSADRFLVAFLGVAVAHGCYNFGSSEAMSEGGGYISVFILAFVAWHFLDLVDQECPRGRQWVSPGAVFLIGTALVMAFIFLGVAFRTPDRHLLVGAASECVAMFPIAFIYWRRLEGR